MQLEEKWQKEWEAKKTFEADPKEGVPKFYLTAAFPYPNSPQHIGHARTYTTTDAHARYMKMNGKNVLFPMAFHVTGTPILAMAKRIAAEDKELLDIFERIYGISRQTAAGLTDPKELVMYFSREIEAGMREMGYSIDWRRKFYTYDPQFNKFIEWQFAKLKEKGYLTMGEHPVPWCPSDNNAIGAHDTRGDVDPELGEYTLLKFARKDGSSLITATFRPETIYGVTNVWLNPNAKYSEVEIRGERYVISDEVAKTMGLQFEIKKIKEISAKELLSEKVKNPMTGEEVPVFPASFVDLANGTGVVMSVPAHAPYDYLALRDLGRTGENAKEGSIPLKEVLAIDGYGKFPAQEICEKLGIKNQDDEKAEDATTEIYRKEAHTGKMVVGKYKGEPVIRAKEKIKADLIAENKAFTMHEIVNGPVFCRCGARCAVKVVRDQWFIDYGNAQWKEDTKKWLAQMKIIPEKTRNEYLYTVDWLKGKACVRAAGLGTRFPFDKTKMIESLSDSTIYMAFYTIAHYLKEMPAENLDEKFFDYVFLGKGSGDEKMKKMREEFLYWYPLDSRHSGADLVHNHLTFFIFNHVAIFEPKLWPRGIVVNGFVLMDGSKMSKSMGNILPLRKAIRQYGTDVVRFAAVSGADLSADSDFSQTLAEGISGRMKFMDALVRENAAASGKGEKNIDKWLRSRLHRMIRNAPERFENFEMRDLTQEIFYAAVNDLKWYQKRTSTPKLREYLENWVLLIAPFMPHYAEEFWQLLGKKQFVPDAALVSLAKFPKADESAIDEGIERGEELVSRTKEDAENILRIIKKEKAGGITIYIASDWKRELYSIAQREKRFDTAMKSAMANEKIKPHAKECAKILQQFMKNIGSMTQQCLTQEQEFRSLSDAAEYLGKEFGCKFAVMKEEEPVKGQEQKAANAMPMKPSIFIE